MFFGSGCISAGVGGALGVELRVMRNLAIAAEIPLSYSFGPSGGFYYFAALSLSGRL